MRRSARWYVAAALIGGVLSAGAWISHRASRALRESGEELRRESELPVRVSLLDRPPATGIEPVSAPAVFVDAIRFQGKLYLCGPAGISEYGSDGTLSARFRPGLELPAAPVVRAANLAGRELYFATDGEGLLAFDGRRFRHIRPEKEAARKVTDLLALPTGRLLIGTHGAGVLVWDEKELSTFHSTLAGLQVTALEGGESSIWAGTLDKGVAHWHAGQVEWFTEGSGLPDSRVLSLAVSGEGETAFVGTGLGVAEFRDGRYTRRLAEGVMARSLKANDNNLVVGTSADGVLSIPLESRRPRLASSPAVRPPVERLLDFDGTLHAVFRDGLYRLGSRGRNWERVLGAEPAMLADRNIAALSVEPDGRLWVGYFDRGLDVVSPALDRAVHVEDDHVFCVNRIVPGRSGAVVATANGLVLFDAAGRPRQVMGRKEGLIASHVTDVAVRPDGLIAATPAGLTWVDASGARSLYAFHGLVNNHVYALGVRGDRVLAGTLGGLSILERGLVKASFTTSNSGLRHNWITAIANVGDDWFIGTYGAGLVRLDDAGVWHRFLDLPADFEVNPNAMLVTEKGVFAGTLNRGLAVYSSSSGRWSFMTSGLPSRNVTAVAAQGEWIYVGTDNGLIRMPGRSVLP